MSGQPSPSRRRPDPAHVRREPTTCWRSRLLTAAAPWHSRARWRRAVAGSAAARLRRRAAERAGSTRSSSDGTGRARRAVRSASRSGAAWSTRRATAWRTWSTACATARHHLRVGLGRQAVHRRRHRAAGAGRQALAAGPGAQVRARAAGLRDAHHDPAPAEPHQRPAQPVADAHARRPAGRRRPCIPSTRSSNSSAATRS